MTTSALESPEACALQLRKLLKMGPQEGDHGAANLAETIVTQLTAHAAFDASEKVAAKSLIDDLRGYFLSPRPFSHETVLQNRRHLDRRITLLQRAIVRHG
jgi:hypothetical protein